MIYFSRQYKSFYRFLVGTRDRGNEDGTGQDRGANGFFIHEDFRLKPLQNDIALIELDKAVELNGLLLSLAKKYGTHVRYI